MTGLFAIAVATALCHNMDPSGLAFAQDKMGEHLHACFMSGRLNPFPARKIVKKIKSTQ